MSLRKFVCALLLLSLCVPQAAASKRRAVQPRNRDDSRYVDVALRVASWLDSIAQPAGEGLAWPFDSANPRAVLAGLPGTAGAGMFYLRLYQATRDARHLDKAQRAAIFIGAQTFSAGNFDWQSGAVGCGSFLMALYRETRDPEQLRRAQRIADGLTAQGVRDDDGGLHWPIPGAPNLYTGMAHGAAGVAMLLLQIHEQAPNATYLAAAEAGLRWAARYTIPLGADGIGWKRITTDNHAYHGWCGGSSGMIFVLAKAYELTGNELYRTLLIKTADGLVASGRQDRSGMSWPQTTNGGPAFLVYCHGTASIVGALSAAFEATGDRRYLETARAGADYLADISEPQDGTRSWPHAFGSDLRQHGFMIGTASIGHSILRLYRHDRDPRLLDVAKETAAFLVGHANSPRESEVRWPVLVEPVPARYAADQAFKNGWWEGTSGIGMYLLELHDYVNGRQPPADFSPANP